jgi:hypothetical protein
MAYKRYNKKKPYVMPPRETDPEKMALYVATLCADLCLLTDGCRSAREDLPQEAMACFITIEKLLKMKGKGGIMTSMWAPRPEPVDAKSNHGETSSSADPVAEEFVPSNLSDATHVSVPLTLPREENFDASKSAESGPIDCSLACKSSPYMFN